MEALEIKLIASAKFYSDYIKFYRIKTHYNVYFNMFGFYTSGKEKTFRPRYMYR